MTLKIYGIAASRAIRPLWVAEELGLNYEHIAQRYQDGATHTPEFLALNPNGHIPVVDDDGVIVWESMACALYLARRFGADFPDSIAPRTHQEEADALRWTFWTVTELEKDALTVLMHRVAMPAEQRKPELAQAAEKRLAAPLRVLEQHLQNRTYIAGERFTVADVTVASVAFWVRPATALMDSLPRTQAWLQSCLSRPAFVRAKALGR
jgi:glutathione S-transferase